jgi:hypothetical protein
MKKKGQGLSLNTIIIAILALLVLVVLVLIFTGQITITIGDMNKCSSRGGTCMASCVDESGKALISMTGTCSGEQVCCAKA